MNNYYHYIYRLSLSCLLCFCLTVKAQTDDNTMRHHVIVAVDMAGCNKWNGGDTIAKMVIKMLDFKNYDQSRDRQLYMDDDYISFLGFRTDADKSDMTTFQLPLNRPNQVPAVYINQSRNYTKKLILGEWSKMVQTRVSDNDQNFSLVSVAKAYALNALRNDSIHVNRTFLVMITDHHYNGNDFYDEIKFFQQKNKSQSKNLSRDSIFKLCYNVEQEYFIRFIKTYSIHLDQFPHWGYVELYEYVPLQRTLSLNSVLRCPPKIKAHRRWGGKYEVKLQILETGDTHYRLERLDVFPFITGHNKRYTSPEGCKSIDCSYVGDSISVDINRSNRPDSLCLRAWVNLRDSVYNATVLSPSALATDYMGREGLNLLIPIEYEPDACILGVIPLCDYMWIPCVSQTCMAWIWSILIAGIVLYSLWLYYKHSSTQEVKVEDIKINMNT